MAKQFLQIAAGVFLLVTAYQIGVERARAEWDATVTGSIMGLTAGASSGTDGLVYTATGEAWALRNNATWSNAAWVDAYDLPVPASSVKFLDDAMTGTVYLITTDDVGWVLNGTTWTSAGPFPGGTVSVDGRGFGTVKGAFRR